MGRPGGLLCHKDLSPSHTSAWLCRVILERTQNRAQTSPRLPGTTGGRTGLRSPGAQGLGCQDHPTAPLPAFTAARGRGDELCPPSPDSRSSLSPDPTAWQGVMIIQLKHLVDQGPVLPVPHTKRSPRPGCGCLPITPPSQCCPRSRCPRVRPAPAGQGHQGDPVPSPGPPKAPAPSPASRSPGRSG